jgi:hypothetical protein
MRAAAAALLESVNVPTANLTDENLQHFHFRGPRNAPCDLVGLEDYGNYALLQYPG